MSLPSSSPLLHIASSTPPPTSNGHFPPPPRPDSLVSFFFFFGTTTFNPHCESLHSLTFSKHPICCCSPSSMSSLASPSTSPVLPFSSPYSVLKKTACCIQERTVSVNPLLYGMWMLEMIAAAYLLVKALLCHLLMMVFEVWTLSRAFVPNIGVEFIGLMWNKWVSW
ncbi:uncharacterized protein LOC132804940 isoform X2 [Ziziphus jujuba]|uniref:Uncharacterized protein LOC132804940 isoform X2 n=1 Tax=Ziziphus jujuba TaxID=326968 RepID=A0ABM4AF60_ZIZJJ|nr:uncharacterized protein LOC132804940 isoform X2 [Ziziphus jujuba]